MKIYENIDITATPTKLDMDRYDYIARYRKINKIAKKHMLYNKKDSDTIIDILNYSSLSLIYIKLLK